MIKALFAAAALLVGSTVLAQVEGDSWKTVNQRGEGTLAVVYYECPKLVEDINGTPQGVAVDVLKDFAQYVKTKYNKTVNIRYVSKQQDFAEYLKTVKNSSNLLGVSNTTITEERKKEMKFSPYYIMTPLVVLTHKSAQNYVSMQQLTTSGLAGLVEKETYYAAFMDKLKSQEFPKLKIQYLNSTADVVTQLSNGAKAFSIMDFTEYLGEVKLNANIKRQPINLKNTTELGFIMSKKSDWDILFNEFLNDSYRNSTQYKQSIAKYLGANFLSLVKQ